MEVIGVFDKDRAGHDEYYYSVRHCILDFRGTLKISPTSYWGWYTHVFTQSHSIDTGEFHGQAIDSPVYVDDYAWITSCCVLTNCHVMHHGIVSVGSVVNKMTVEPYTIVAGNPARPVAKWDGEKWVKLRR